MLPLEKKLSALEEAEFEDDGGEEGALDREMLSQGMDLFFLLSPFDSFPFFFTPVINSYADVTGL